jgi:hypothetical protein
MQAPVKPTALLLPLLAGGGWEGVKLLIFCAKSDPTPTLPCEQVRERPRIVLSARTMEDFEQAPRTRGSRTSSQLLDHTALRFQNFRQRLALDCAERNMQELRDRWRNVDIGKCRNFTLVLNAEARGNEDSLHERI